MPVAAKAVDLALAEWARDCADDPLRFVLEGYPWQEPGALQDYDGPDTWQHDFLVRLGEQVRARGFNGSDAVAAIREAVSSGHGIGKTSITAWVVDWIMSTRPFCHGTVTANSFPQLQTKTWAAIQKWTKLCVTAEWFVLTSERMYHRDHRDNWFVAAQSSKEENSESFAGQHAADSTSFYIFDESSAIAEVIFDVAEGGLTDGEPMIFVLGNPTKSQGRFHQICFGSLRGRWNQTIIDSRDSKFTNKAQIAEWIQDYGEDSDFVRVRVRGLPPSASDLQFIGSDVVYAAQKRDASVLADEPLVAGLDLARGGSDECVFRFRRGKDARTIPPIRIPGEQSRDSMKVATLAADVLGRDFHGRKIHTLFVDATGGSIGGPIADRLRQLGHANVIDVQFGGESPDPKYANMRSYIWGKMRDWLPTAAIDATAQLETDLTSPGYRHDKRDRLLLESKEQMKARGVDSPDDGDALALTHTAVVLSEPGSTAPPYRPSARWS